MAYLLFAVGLFIAVWAAAASALFTWRHHGAPLLGPNRSRRLVVALIAGAVIAVAMMALLVKSLRDVAS